MNQVPVSRPLIATMCAAVLLIGCSSTTDGQPTASDTLTSTLTSAAPRTTATTSTYVPESPYSLVKRVLAYWDSVKVKTGNVTPQQVPVLTCKGSEINDGITTALYCDGGKDAAGQPLPDYIRWLPTLVSDMDDPVLGTAAYITLAHEAGHAVQDFAGTLQGDDGAHLIGGVKAAELSADCLAGYYFAHGGDHVDTKLLDTALLHTNLSDPKRLAEFSFGLDVAEGNADICLRKYESS